MLTRTRRHLPRRTAPTVACAGALALCFGATTAAAQTRPVRDPFVILPVPDGSAPIALRAAAVRAACYDAHGVDALTWASASAMVSVGAGLTVTALATPGIAQQNSSASALLAGLGPGLVLGGLGVVFARGALSGRSPLHAACDAVLRRWPGRGDDDAIDTAVAERMLRVYAEPVSVVPTILLGVATVGVGATLAASLAVNNVDLITLSGGLLAAVLTGWLTLPPTPQRVAAQRFVAGRYDQAGFEGRAGSRSRR